MIARWFWREWRSPSLLIVWLALSLAVACVLALGSVSDRMEKGLSQQSREFMAGDRALQSSRPVPPGWIEEARKEGLKVGEQITFQTMTFAGDTPQLASVKAVDDIYPMYGELQTSPPGLKPKPGTVLLRGHTHVPRGETIDGLHFWNPGSLSLPKGGAPRTYGIVESGVFTVLDMQGGEILRHAPAEL